MGARARARASGAGFSSSKQDAYQDQSTAKKDESKSLLRQTLRSEEFKRQIKADNPEQQKGISQNGSQLPSEKKAPKVGVEKLIPRLRVGEITKN